MDYRFVPLFVRTFDKFLDNKSKIGSLRFRKQANLLISGPSEIIPLAHHGSARHVFHGHGIIFLITCKVVI